MLNISPLEFHQACCMEALYMDKCKKKADQDTALGGIPAKAFCFAMFPVGKLTFSVQPLYLLSLVFLGARDVSVGSR